MYQPSRHREDELEKQHSLIVAHPLGLLVTNGSEGLTANPVPFRLHPSLSKFGVLRAHIARANPLWRDGTSLREALVVFQGVDAYISPSWYATKRENGKVVPTWNYVSVHVHGPIQVIADPDWLRRQIHDLTAVHESSRPAPWSVDDAPAEFIDQMLPAIIGIEIEISRIEGKLKVSQNRAPEDRAGVAAGLRAAGDGRSLAMAALVEEAKKT